MLRYQQQQQQQQDNQNDTLKTPTIIQRKPNLNMLLFLHLLVAIMTLYPTYSMMKRFIKLDIFILGGGNNNNNNNNYQEFIRSSHLNNVTEYLLGYILGHGMGIMSHAFVQRTLLLWQLQLVQVHVRGQGRVPVLINNGGSSNINCNSSNSNSNSNNNGNNNSNRNEIIQQSNENDNEGRSNLSHDHEFNHHHIHHIHHIHHVTSFGKIWEYEHEIKNQHQTNVFFNISIYVGYILCSILVVSTAFSSIFLIATFHKEG
jgi:hypothetical protein